MTPPRNPKLAQVALAAGVSVSTASEALRGVGRMSDQTRKRVRRVARELGYIPDARARALRTGTVRMVGLVTDIPEPIGTNEEPRLFWPRLLTAFTDELSKSEVGVSLLSDVNPASLEKLPVDALVRVTTTSQPLPDAVLDRLTVLNIDLVDDSDSHIHLEAGLHNMVAATMDHLVDSGARRPALFALKPIPPTFTHVVTGYRAWCTDRGMEPLILAPDFVDRSEDTFSLAVAVGVDGLFSVLGESAAILAEAQAANITIPKKMKLISLSEGAIEAHLGPTVSTVSLRGADVGTALARAVMGMLKGGQDADVPVTFILQARESTGV